MDETFLSIAAMTCGALNAGVDSPFWPREISPTCFVDGVSLPFGIPSSDGSSPVGFARN